MENTKEKLKEIIANVVYELQNSIIDDITQKSFSEIVCRTQEIVNRLGTQLIENIVQMADEHFNSQRDKHCIILRHTKTRKMVSAMGDINLTRRLYFNKAQNKYFFAVDEMLGIEKYSRVEGEFKSKLVRDAVLTSYGKASALSNSSVTRQTVHNIVKRIPSCSLNVKPSKELKKIDTLYIEADEDHIHLNNGQPADIKIVYVHEGRKTVKNRVTLINAKYFVSMKIRGVWEVVSDYVFNQYLIENKNIHILGDGAAWIKSGLNSFPGACFHIDKFHVYRNVRSIVTADKRISSQIINCIKNEDMETLQNLYSNYYNSVTNSRIKRRIKQSLAYIDNNFDYIDLLSDLGCSAEGHVSHVLSARMSSRPMAWSIAGADKMSKLRAFYFNGGSFSNLIKLQ